LRDAPLSDQTRRQRVPEVRHLPLSLFDSCQPSRYHLGGDEPGVSLIELLADGLAKGVEAGSRGFLRTDRLAVRVLRQDRRTAEGLSFFFLLLGTRLLFDLSEKRGDALATEIVRQTAPAGERIEREDLEGGIGEAIEILCPAPGGVLLSAIEPESLQGLAGEQSVDGVPGSALSGRSSPTLCKDKAYAFLWDGSLSPGLSRYLGSLLGPASRADRSLRASSQAPPAPFRACR
jgi:hypothetical protein